MSNINKKDSNIIIRVDKESKDFFKKIVEKEGYTTSKVLSAFIDGVCMSEEIPSDIIKKMEYEKKFLITIPYIKKVLEEVIGSMEKDVIDKIYLFGSYARGEETNNSDIDLRIVGKEGMSLFDVGYIIYEVEEKTGKKVDIISGNNIDPVVYETIKRDEICIYE